MTLEATALQEISVLLHALELLWRDEVVVHSLLLIALTRACCACVGGKGGRKGGREGREGEREGRERGKGGREGREGEGREGEREGRERGKGGRGKGGRGGREGERGKAESMNYFFTSTTPTFTHDSNINEDKCHNVTRGTGGKSYALHGHTQDPAALSEHNEHQMIE